MLPWRSLTWVWSHRDRCVQACSLGGCSLVLAPKEVSGSGLLRQRSLVRAWSCGYPWLRPAPMKVTGLGLLLRRLLASACSWGSLWLGPGPTKVTVQACSLRGLSLVPALGEVAAYSILNLKEASCCAISLLSCGISDTKGQL